MRLVELFLFTCAYSGAIDALESRADCLRRLEVKDAWLAKLVWTDFLSHLRFRVNTGATLRTSSKGRRLPGFDQRRRNQSQGQECPRVDRVGFQGNGSRNTRTA